MNVKVAVSLNCHNVGENTGQKNLIQFIGSIFSQNELQNVKCTASKCEIISLKMTSILHKLKL